MIPIRFPILDRLEPLRYLRHMLKVSMTGFVLLFSMQGWASDAELRPKQECSIQCFFRANADYYGPNGESWGNYTQAGEPILREEGEDSQKILDQLILRCKELSNLTTSSVTMIANQTIASQSIPGGRAEISSGFGLGTLHKPSRQIRLFSDICKPLSSTGPTERP